MKVDTLTPSEDEYSKRTHNDAKGKNHESNKTIDRRELFELYKMVVETDRYELDLGWKLVQFFTVLNSGLFTAGITLLGSNQIQMKPIVSLIFVIGIILSIISIYARKSYHRHSLTASYKKTLIEKELGLYNPIKVDEHDFNQHNLAISTSASLIPKPAIFDNPEKYIGENVFKRWTVPYYHKLIFEAFIAINLLGILFSLKL